MSAGEDLELSPERVSELLRDGRAQLVDVREPEERAAGRIPGARPVELTRLAAEAESIDRGRPVVFHCRMGARSAMAAQAFRASGWEAYNLTGGIEAWAGRGLPLAPGDGGPGDR